MGPPKSLLQPQPMSFLEKLAGAIGKFSDPRIVRDPRMEELAGEEGVALAQQQARAASMHAMMQPGIPWYAMTVAGDAEGQLGYSKGIAGAADLAEKIRARRDSDERRKRLADLIANAPNLTKADGTPEFSRLQLDTLGALSADEQAKIFGTYAFPKMSPSGTATAGSVQAVKRGPNGNILAVVQTGDPYNPVTVVDTGVQTEAELPSEIRSRIALANDPTLIDVNARDKQAETTGAETGKANVAFDQMAGTTLAQTQADLASYQTLKAQVAGLDSGPIKGPVMAKLNADFQVADARMKMQGLRMIGELKAAGISLTPITERELAILMQPTPQLTNYKEANLTIIEDRVQSLQRIISQLESQIAFRDQGGDITRWRGTRGPAQPAPAAAPAQRSVVPPEQRRVQGLN